MKRESCKLLIIGAGPGGYACAIRAGQLGLDTIVVEANAPGGTCLNVGCIPSKALIHAANEFYTALHLSGVNQLGISTSKPQIDFSKTVTWKDGIVKRLTDGVAGLMKKANVRVFNGWANIIDGKTIDVETPDGPVRISTENLVIATGSRPQEIASLPFSDEILSSTEILSLDQLPKRLAVVGGGYIGLEIGTAMAKLGSQVTVVEAAPRILPQYDVALTRPVAKRLEALGVNVLTNAKALGYESGVLSIGTDDGPQDIQVEKLLATVGRTPVIEGFGLEGLMLDMVGRFITIDDKCQTSMHGVYAIGDVAGDPMLAHRAMAQGTLVAEIIGGREVIWDKRAIPAVCFTDPEIVTVGKMPEEAPDAEVTLFPFTGNGRSMTLERDDGFVRIVFDKETELVHGIQAVGAGVSEMAGQFSLALEMAATLTDIAETIHAHPTLGETVQESAMSGLGRALHI